ncbi:hypothetical protein D9M69_678130 [compost metagenome]
MQRAFVQHAQHQIDGGQHGQDQPGLVLQALLEVAGVAAQAGLDMGGHHQPGHGGVDGGQALL